VIPGVKHALPSVEAELASRFAAYDIDSTLLKDLHPRRRTGSDRRLTLLHGERSVAERPTLTIALGSRLLTDSAYEIVVYDQTRTAKLIAAVTDPIAVSVEQSTSRR